MLKQADLISAKINKVLANRWYSLLHSEWRTMLYAVSMMVPCCIIFLDDTLFKSSVYLLLLLSLLLMALGLAFRRKTPTLALIVTFIAIGIGASSIRLLSIPASTLNKETYAVVHGSISEMEVRDSGSLSMTIKLSQPISKLQSGELIKLTIRTGFPNNLKLGDRVTLNAILEPLRGSLVPDGYNFERSNRHKGIVAVGYSVAPVELLEDSEPEPISIISQTRKKVEAELLSALPDQTGAVAVALTVGYRGHLSYETQESLKRAGLSHLLAISGLHMGLVTGGIFFLFEFLFAAIPALALRVMPKKLAVIPAWLGGMVYLFLSGGSVSTLRAFLMVTVAMIAVLSDRRILSLRSVAIAVILILLIRPESVLSIGFQMSFAATAGLVAFYEAWSQHKRKRQTYDRQRGVLRKGATFLGGIAVTSLIAQASVALFSLYHFQELSLIAIVGNVLVLPIVSLIVMPLLLVGFILPWSVVAEFIHFPLAFILDIAEELAGFEDAVLHTGHIDGWAFVVSSILFLLILMIPRVQVAAGLAAFMVLILAVGRQVPPDMMISESGKLVVLQENGALYEWGLREGSFRDRVWRQYLAIDYKSDAKALDRLCSDSACRYSTPVPISNVQYLEHVYESCNAGDIVILPRRYKRYCKGAALLLTEAELSAYGPLAIWLNKKGGITTKWSNPPKAKVSKN